MRADQKSHLLKNIRECFAVQLSQWLADEVTRLRSPEPTGSNDRRSAETTSSPLLHDDIPLAGRCDTISCACYLSHQNGVVANLPRLRTAHHKNRTFLKGFFREIAKWEEYEG